MSCKDISIIIIESGTALQYLKRDVERVGVSVSQNRELMGDDGPAEKI